MRQYIDYASTKSEAKEKADALLRQIYSGDTNFTTIRSEAEDGKGGFLFFTLSLNTGREKYTPDEAIRKLPTVFVARGEAETSESPGRYWLYLLESIDKLPYYVKQLTRLEVLLPYVMPVQRDDTPLSVEAMHTPDGRYFLEGILAGKECRQSLKEDVDLFQGAPKELKLYALFDNCGEMTLEEIRDELEAGTYDGGTRDGELILSASTGEKYDTLEKYIAKLSEICGADVVGRYRAKLEEGYNFYSVNAYIQYLEYRLRQTEDYELLSKEEPELAKRYGYQATALNGLRENKQTSTALEIALAHYLKDYLDFRSLYDGLSYTRIADYMRIPASTIERVVIDEDLRREMNGRI